MKDKLKRNGFPVQGSPSPQPSPRHGASSTQEGEGVNSSASRSLLPSFSPLGKTRSWSLMIRLVVWYAVSALVLILITAGFTYWNLVKNMASEDRTFLIREIRTLQKALMSSPMPSPSQLRQEVETWALSAHPHDSPLYLRILNAQTGRTLAETPGFSQMLPAQAFPPPFPTLTGREPATELRPPHGRLSFQALSVQFSGGPKTSYTLQAALDNTFDRDIAEDLLEQYWDQLWVILVGVFLLSLLIGYGITRHGLRPLQAMAQTARRIQSSTLHERLDVRGFPTELIDLASTFNNMLDRLEESFAQLSQFSQDIAHELRTPLANLRGEIEVALGRGRSPEEYHHLLDSCLEECLRLSRLIDRLLFLARTENPEARLEKEPVEVHQELEALRDFYEPAASEGGLQLTLSVPVPLTAQLDRLLFQHAIGNLLENALAYTPRGGTISIHAYPTHPGLRVEISDTGQGISPEHLPHIFNRFYRVDPSRSKKSGGMGLGLAIVQSIVKLHAGSVSIESTLRQGTRILLSFP